MHCASFVRLAQVGSAERGERILFTNCKIKRITRGWAIKTIANLESE